MKQQSTKNINSRYVIYKVKSIGQSIRGNRKPCTLLGAARHNLRKINAELGPGSTIDHSRSMLNVVLLGPETPEGINDLVKIKTKNSGIDIRTLRRDYVQAVEIMISLNTNLSVEYLAFFSACAEWASLHFGTENILSAIVHQDEAKPHIHILISPIVGGKAAGSSLINRGSLMRQRQAFQEQVAEKYGLQLPPAKLTLRNQLEAANQVYRHLAATYSPLLKDKAWPSIQAAIRKDPVSFIADYGIDLQIKSPAQKMKTSTDIFTSNGKGAKQQTK
jgi:hypothetical protein